VLQRSLDLHLVPPGQQHRSAAMGQQLGYHLRTLVG
jgi:hypothetical protein